MGKIGLNFGKNFGALTRKIKQFFRLYPLFFKAFLKAAGVSPLIFLKNFTK